MINRISLCLFMKNIVFTALFSLTASICIAQNLNYTDLMYFASNDDFEIMNSFLETRGYEIYQYNSVDNDKIPQGEDVTLMYVIWCRNCTYDFYSTQLLTSGPSFSCVIWELFQDWVGFQTIRIKMLFPNKDEYISFLEAAKQDGYTSKNGNNFYSRSASRLMYAKYHILNEFMSFHEENGVHHVLYWHNR